MDDALPLVLHHFDASPFAEKIRLVLGIKGLAWRSVEIPMVMPKPQLTALTGGYRKTPVLQIGADVYCDTQRIAWELERRYPTPSLFPDGRRAMAQVLGAWSDGRFFRSGAALSMGTNPDLPEQVLADRRAFFSFLDFSTLQEDLPHFYAQFQAQLALVDSMLEETDGDFLSGDGPGWIDILAYFPIWMARGNIADTADLLSAFPSLRSWEQLMNSIGHGQRTAMDAQEALAIAHDSDSAATSEVDPAARSQGLSVGDEVLVMADDYGQDAVRGNLMRLTRDAIAVRREDSLAGEVVVHFPRSGFEVRSA